MTYTDFLIDHIEANRAFTMRTFERAVELDALGWRPGPGRAHCAWQFMHVAATEEVFACKRFHDRDVKNHALVEAYQHGSTPVDEIPAADAIRSYLTEARAMVIDAIRELDESQLDVIPPMMAERNRTYKQGLHLVSWHEGHHQGQAHITLNLFENRA